MTKDDQIKALEARVVELEDMNNALLGKPSKHEVLDIYQGGIVVNRVLIKPSGQLVEWHSPQSPTSFNALFAPNDRDKYEANTSCERLKVDPLHFAAIVEHGLARRPARPSPKQGVQDVEHVNQTDT